MCHSSQRELLTCSSVQSEVGFGAIVYRIFFLVMCKKRKKVKGVSYLNVTEWVYTTAASCHSTSAMMHFHMNISTLDIDGSLQASRSAQKGMAWVNSAKCLDAL